MNEGQDNGRYLARGVVDLGAVRKEVEAKRESIARLDSGAELIQRILDVAKKPGVMPDADHIRINDLHDRIQKLRRELNRVPYWSAESSDRCMRVGQEINIVAEPYLPYLPSKTLVEAERAAVPLLTYRGNEEEKNANEAMEDRVRGIIMRLINLEEGLENTPLPRGLVASQRKRFQEFIELRKNTGWTKEDRKHCEALIDRIATIFAVQGVASNEELDSIFGDHSGPNDGEV